MNDLEIAKSRLAGHTICLCKGGGCVYSDKRGIRPMIDFIDGGVDLTGYSVADKVVGKAAALLFVRCGIVAAFAETLSESAKRVLEEHGVYTEYRTLAEKIINRDGTDVCPMEKSVSAVDSPDEAYAVLKKLIK